MLDPFCHSGGHKARTYFKLTHYAFFDNLPGLADIE